MSEYVFSWWFGTGNRGSGEGQFNNPLGIALDRLSNVYVADTGNNRVQKFRFDGHFIRTWGSFGKGKGELRGPSSIAVDRSGNVYVSERDNHRIQKFGSAGNFIRAWGQEGSGDGEFVTPLGIDVDSFGNVYVADTGNNRIQKFTSDGTFVTKWGSQGSGNGELYAPTDVTVFSHPLSESLGTVYVTDSHNGRIQIFRTYGTFVTKWGSPGSGEGQFRTPFGLIVERAPNSSPKVFVADTNNRRIQQFGFLGLFLTKWGSPGSGEGQFIFPMDLAVTVTYAGGAQFIYVLDAGQNRIQVFVNKL